MIVGPATIISSTVGERSRPVSDGGVGDDTTNTPSMQNGGSVGKPIDPEASRFAASTWYHHHMSETTSARTDLTGPVEVSAHDDATLGAIEAILLTADRPATSSRIAEAVGLSPESGAAEVGACVETLNDQYERTGRSFRIEKVAGGLRIVTLPEHADAIAAFHNLGASARLSRAAIETLSIVAYRQPVTRAQVEAIRGVACGEVLRTLLERRLIAIAGRADEVGRPLLYGTSRQFLEEFGLASLKDLPSVEGDTPQVADTGQTAD